MRKSIEGFLNARFGTSNVPEDLDALLNAITKHEDFAQSELNPIVQFGAELLWAEQTYPLLDHTYLNDNDRSDLFIMANIAAMQDTGLKLKYFLQKADTSLLGYWQPDEDVPLSSCDLFWLDTEGQYLIAEGESLSETLAYHALVESGPARMEAVSKAFALLGVDIPQISEDEIFSRMDNRDSTLSESPQDFRQKRYEHYTKQIEQPEKSAHQPSFFQKVMQIWRGKD